METTSIYILLDPDTKEPRYVGKSDKPNIRYKQHLSNLKSRSIKTCWIKSLILKGKKPILEVIEVISINDWQKAECYYIEEYRNLGANLTNMSDGGLGGLSGKNQKRIQVIKRKLGKMYSDAKKANNKRLERYVGSRLLAVAKSNPSIVPKWWMEIQLP